mgnify:FL=1
MNARGYTQIMKEQMLKGEEHEVSIKHVTNFYVKFSAKQSFVNSRLISLTTVFLF